MVSRLRGILRSVHSDSTCIPDSRPTNAVPRLRSSSGRAKGTSIRQRAKPLPPWLGRQRPRVLVFCAVAQVHGLVTLPRTCFCGKGQVVTSTWDALPAGRSFSSSRGVQFSRFPDLTAHDRAYGVMRTPRKGVPSYVEANDWSECRFSCC